MGRPQIKGRILATAGIVGGPAPLVELEETAVYLDARPEGQPFSLFIWRNFTPGSPSLGGNWPIVEVVQSVEEARYTANFASGPHTPFGSSLEVIVTMPREAGLVAVVYASPIEGGNIGWTEE